MSRTIHTYNADSNSVYKEWISPIVIISDGPYGINGFKGDLNTPTGLDSWYEPHIKIWSEIATPPNNIMVLEYRDWLGYRSSNF